MDDPPATIRFGPFALDRENRRLSRDGAPVELGSRYFDALVLLVDRRGELVTKDAFMEEVWRGIPVTDEALTQGIRTLRRALGDDASAPRFIQTVPKHGYRFVGEIADEPADRADAPRASLPSRVAGACTLAGLGAGVFAGLVYGVIAGTGGGGRALVLAAMVGALGLLAGAGLGAGMAGALAWRGRVDATLVAGGALGGLLVGALGSMLGREAIGLLTGRVPGEVTGPFEGLLLGIATGVAALVALRGARASRALALAALCGAMAGVLVHAARGSLLATTLWSLQTSLPGTQLAMERLGFLTASQTFSAAAQGLTAVVEGAVFVLAMTLGLLAARPRRAG